MDKRILTVPNQLTFLRLTFLPFFIIAIRYNRYGWALIILVVAGLSDTLDGLLARSLNQRSPLGAYLDPIADKLLLSSSFLVLSFESKISWWLTILVLGRDVLLLTAAATILLVLSYRSFPPSIFGKAATTFQVLLIFLVLLKTLISFPGLEMARLLCVYAVAAFTIVSGLHYGVTMARRLHGDA